MFAALENLVAAKLSNRFDKEFSKELEQREQAVSQANGNNQNEGVGEVSAVFNLLSFKPLPLYPRERAPDIRLIGGSRTGEMKIPLPCRQSNANSFAV
jgi:hypothetical protein